MTIFCNDNHFEKKEVNTNKGKQIARHDTVGGGHYPDEGDSNGRFCTGGNDGTFGYRYKSLTNANIDYVVFCDRLFNENREGRVSGLFISDYAKNDQSNGKDGEPGIDEYHLLAATILHEMTHTVVSCMRSKLFIPRGYFVAKALD